LIDNSEKELVGTGRWSVGIYQFGNLKYEFLSHGSIIAPNIVIAGKIVVQCI